MKTYVLYNRRTAAERWAGELIERLQREGIGAELVDVDSPRGIELAEHYDVLDRPAVLVVRDDGSPVSVWQGQDGMPLTSDIVYAAHN